MKLRAFLCVCPLLDLWGTLYRTLVNRLSRYSRKISTYLRVGDGGSFINGDCPNSLGTSGKLLDSIISSEILQYHFRVFRKWYIDHLQNSPVFSSEEYVFGSGQRFPRAGLNRSSDRGQTTQVSWDNTRAGWRLPEVFQGPSLDGFLEWCPSHVRICMAFSPRGDDELSFHLIGSVTWMKSDPNTDFGYTIKSWRSNTKLG